MVEGPKAGGHLGFSKEAVQQLTQEEYDKVIVSIVEKAKEYSQKAGRKIPVIAAGGIFDRQDMEHALSLGADGVQVGTRFVTTKECDADTRYKESIVISVLKAVRERIFLIALQKRWCTQQWEIQSMGFCFVEKMRGNAVKSRK